VVAADEGVREQTREHLAIAELLGIPDAVVALTKCDLVDDELAGLVELEIAELLAPTRWKEASIFRVSSATNAGVGELAGELVARARAAGSHPFADAPVRLPIDRAFAPGGQGVVVARSARHRPGRRRALSPSERTSRFALGFTAGTARRRRRVTRRAQPAAWRSSR
jgi:selenocysteine-specific elongation factor